jgi:hypothetical protein
MERKEGLLSALSRGTLVALAASIAAAASCSSARDETRVPSVHRVLGASCPSDRGAGSTAVCGANTARPAACAGDSTCTAGTNGRCITGFGPACSLYCSYDECSGDSDCPGNAPCACRSAATDSAANTCATASNCRVDADCGPGGFCSPSLVATLCFCIGESFCKPGESAGCAETDSNGVTVQVPCSCSGNCGHGYFCHTPKDSCVDDSDCPAGKTCNYDQDGKSWVCSGCLSPP